MGCFLQRVGDIKTAYRPFWVYENPDVPFVKRNELLRSAWNEATHLVAQNNKILILMESKGNEMPGALIPSEYLYEFHHAFPHLKHLDPIHHVSRRQLTDNFDELKHRLWDRQNLVVVGGEGYPEFAIANWGFVACELEIDQSGFLGFREQFSQYAFSGKVYQYEPDVKAMEAVQQELGGMINISYPPQMNEKDSKIVETIIQRLQATSPGQDNYSQAVRSAYIDLQ